MSKGTVAAIYFLIWLVCLFTVLPWGVRSQEEGGEVTPGSDPGAPATPNLRAKLLYTTIVASLIFAAGYIVYVNHLVTVASLLAPFGLR